MRLTWMTVWLAVGSVSPVWAQERSATPPDVDAVIREFAAAFNAHDAARLAGMFAPDATLINPVGKRAVGRPQVEALLRSNFETTLKGVTCEVTVERVRLVAPDLAFIDVEQRLSGGTPPPGVPNNRVAHVVILARKEAAGRWVVLDFRPYFFRQAPASSASAPATGGAAPAGTTR